MILSNILIGTAQYEQFHLISVSFTALVLNELIMIAIEIHTWHKYMVWAEILTFAFYFLSIPFLEDYYGTPLRPYSPPRASDFETNDRSILYHYMGVCLEDFCHITG